MLRKYMSDRGKIRSRRVTGNCAQHQRALAQAIKTARELILLPYTQRTVTERPGGRGGGRDRGERGERGERAERTLSDTIGADAPRTATRAWRSSAMSRTSTARAPTAQRRLRSTRSTRPLAPTAMAPMGQRPTRRATDEGAPAGRRRRGRPPRGHRQGRRRLRPEFPVARRPGHPGQSRRGGPGGPDAQGPRPA